MSTQQFLLVVPAFGALALLFAFIRAIQIRRRDPGPPSMNAIANYIEEGAMAFLTREYLVMGMVVAVVAGILGLVYFGSRDTSPLVTLSFVTGAACSALAGFAGMKVATKANVRTAQAAKTSLNMALRIAFNGGTVMGMAVVGLGVMGLGSLFLLFCWIFHVPVLTGIIAQDDLRKVLTTLTGFSLGASTVALFARVGGGIYTKAADIGADIVGKVERNIPEDDPRNPAVIADNVGDNVGDVAGMGADLFESYVGAIVGVMILGVQHGLPYVILPLVLSSIGIVFSILGTFFVRTREKGDPQAALNRGTWIASAGTLVFGAAAVLRILGSRVPSQRAEFWDSLRVLLWRALAGTAAENPQPGAVGVIIAMMAGLGAGVAIGFATEYYTSASREPTRAVARDSVTGASMNLIGGLGLGMRSTAVPMFLLALAILISYRAAGIYGIAVAALGMLLTTGIQLAVDAYGPIADNAGGIASMAKLPARVRERTDRLDSVGNTTAAIGKGFAIGSAALTALALFAAYAEQAGISNIDLSNPEVIAGVFMGAAMPFLFSALAIKAVGKAAFDMIQEVRRQFREIPGLLAGKARADYAKCVDISAAAALKRMVKPALMAIFAPIIFGIYNKQMLAGLLAGATVTGVMLAMFMANAGGAWDNAKKYVESGQLKDEKGRSYGKGSAPHHAAVVGDTTGDPLKDTAGPSLNILIKLMSLVSLTLAPLIR